MLEDWAEYCDELRFTYHGFRYVEVTGFPGVPTLQSLEGRAVHFGVESAGGFTSSSSLLNRTHSNFRWSILNNSMGIPTDTAVRDERTPCQMDSLVAEGSAVHRDSAGEKSIPVWSGDQVFLPMLLFEHYGDRRVLEENWNNIKSAPGSKPLPRERSQPRRRTTSRVISSTGGCVRQNRATSRMTASAIAPAPCSKRSRSEVISRSSWYSSPAGSCASVMPSEYNTRLSPAPMLMGVTVY
ncbi:MAG: family 78 glycoside hydrolase catalytic domain [Acidobacteriia bacterium]|nr:family 78 glycoside hydrolase catalytic domain [Terriglobia bacterium]